MNKRARKFIGRIIMKMLPLQFMPSFNRLVLRFMGYEIGSGVVFFSSSEILGLVELIVGNNSFVGHKVLIMGGESTIKIGSNCDVSSCVNIITGTHHISNFNRRAGTGISRDIAIGDGTWIGFGVTILGNVKIGRGCIIAAGSLVNKDIPDNVLAAGVPAKIIKELVDDFN